MHSEQNVIKHLSVKTTQINQLFAIVGLTESKAEFKEPIPMKSVLSVLSKDRFYEI
jgi:hypothetical protein